MSAEFHVVFALYPRVTQLDFTGPFEVFARLPHARCTLASVTGGTIQGDGGITFAGVARLADVTECALLCVPGGLGTVTALGDSSYISAVRRLGTQAQYVTSVCTGSLLLAAAGLLHGKKAACHWAWRDHLKAFAVEPSPDRVVRDGNVTTGGGVTAGIDMALALTAQIAGVDHAQTVQLALEYAPEPPFDCGRPELARPQIVATAQRRLDGIRAQRDAAVKRAAELLTHR
ncbi:MAG TPA: DJ-1/PfpI family protein [Steroidobacteraceae bacterium]|nr:DJ-1/PfpI family protein [Steroidobacteraceae bacterium]